MERFIDYIESSCSGLGKSHSAYRYKKKVLDEMTEKANMLTRAGLKDEKVLKDLIADEYGNVQAGFKKWEKENRRKKFTKTVLPIGAIISLVLILLTYFAVSGFTGAWSKTWLIIVGGVFAIIIFALGVAISEICRMRRVFHPIARLLLVISTVLLFVFAFLYTIMMIPGMTSWPLLPVGIIFALVADMLFAFVTKQKLRTISVLVYMPVISTMLYVILSAYGVISWISGWPVVLLGLVADLVYILFIIMSNAKYFMYKQGVDE